MSNPDITLPSRAALWHAVWEQASSWAATEAVSRFAEQLPRNSFPMNDGLPKLLQEMRAGTAALFASPFRLSGLLPFAASVMPGMDLAAAKAAYPRWFDAAARVEAAHRITVAWLRARLPGYPLLPAPHLSPNTPLTTTEFTDRIVWAPGERQRGLHMTDPAPGVAELLLDDKRGTDINETARLVVGSLEASPEWVNLRRATAALDPAGRSALTDARKNLRVRLSRENVDAYEPRFALNRNAYRENTLREEVNLLSGRALDYANAFEAANNLIDQASDVLGQIACYRLETFAASNLEVLEPGLEVVIEFVDTRVLAIFTDVGEIGWVDHPLVADAVMVESMMFSLSDDPSTRLTARTLPGTGEAWRAIT